MSYRSRLIDPGSALATALVAAALLAGLVFGLRGSSVSAVRPADLLAFTPAPPAPPPPLERPRPHVVRSPKPQGKAAPPGLRARATDLVLPAPVVVLPAPLMLAAAPTPGSGTASHVGNSSTAGTGPGAGGSGDGSGSGGTGDGDGDGGETAPRWRHGRLKLGDFPAGAGEITREWVVGVRYLVDVDGRVPRCEVSRPSGLPELDAVTCRLIEQRFRFDPSRDAAGRPVAAWIVESHGWGREHDPGDTIDQ